VSKIKKNYPWQCTLFKNIDEKINFEYFFMKIKDILKEHIKILSKIISYVLMIK
jgi:hypothetical protein